MINEEEFKKIVADNLIKYRKINKLTQADLANRLNYSDKAISKWERGESIPDTYTLMIIAEFYQIELNDLTQKSDIIPAPIEKSNNKKFTRLFVPLLSCGIAVFIAIIVFVLLTIIMPNSGFHNWLVFIYITPVVGIIATVFTALWYEDILRGISVSTINWGIITSVFLTLTIYTNFDSLWLIFLLGVGLEVLIILWFLMKFLKKHPDFKFKKKIKNE